VTGEKRNKMGLDRGLGQVKERGGSDSGLSRDPTIVREHVTKPLVNTRGWLISKPPFAN
jgi:hypothetical protein